MFLSLSASASAEIYKWTDGQGRLHYSDQPPTLEAQTINAPSSGQATEAAAQALHASEQAFRKRQQDTEAARTRAETETRQARINQEKCEKARANLSSLQDAPRIYTRTAQGQRAYLSDSERAQALRATRKTLAENCR